MYTCVYRCTDLSIRVYINVHLQTLQGKSNLEKDNPGGLVLLLFSRFVFV